MNASCKIYRQKLRIVSRRNEGGTWEMKSYRTDMWYEQRLELSRARAYALVSNPGTGR